MKRLILIVILVIAFVGVIPAKAQGTSCDLQGDSAVIVLDALNQEGVPLNMDGSLPDLKTNGKLVTVQVNAVIALHIEDDEHALAYIDGCLTVIQSNHWDKNLDTTQPVTISGQVNGWLPLSLGYTPLIENATVVNDIKTPGFVT